MLIHTGPGQIKLPIECSQRGSGQFSGTLGECNLILEMQPVRSARQVKTTVRTGPRQIESSVKCCKTRTRIAGLSESYLLILGLRLGFR
jgi:hypothetical protein